MLEQDEFLVAFHKRHAGATSAAFANGKTSDGLSSYDLLVECVVGDVPREPGAVLDLGCGDGHLLELLAAAAPALDLVGVDFSPDELALASKRPALGDTRLLLARGQDLPLADGSISHVVSHLAFMLMSDVELVVDEIARVLASGGQFSTVVGGGPRTGDAFEIFLELLLPACREGKRSVPPIGDRRTRTDSGLAELFREETGFYDGTITDFYVALDGPIEEVWASLSTVYEADALTARQLSEVRRRFEERVAGLVDADGRLPCTMATRRFTVRRR